MKKGIVIFDFCETLINFQTADAFIDFIVENENYKIGKIIRLITNFLDYFKLIRLINKIHPKLNIYKKVKLLEIRGLPLSKLDNYSEQFFNSKIRSSIIPETIELFERFQKQSYSIFIVSGGYKNYIDLFANCYGFDGVISTQIEIKNNLVTGFMDGLDCLFDSKVTLMNKIIKKENYIETVSISDSITDLPLLLWADRAIVISKQHQKWVEKYDFKEIIV